MLDDVTSLIMHRTQISLEERQYERLMREAKRLRISLSELLRRMVDRQFQQLPEPQNPLSTITGLGEGDGTAVGREHNRFLYGKGE